MENKKSSMDQLIEVLSDNDMPYENKVIKGLHFVLTCASCPEQYDVFDAEGNQVGYVRFRWGHLTCEYPDCGGLIVYETDFDDGWQGCFANESDRTLFLEEIANAIYRNIDKSNMHPVKKVFCFDNFESHIFGSWYAGYYYDVVRYDSKSEEWHIKDHNDCEGIVDNSDFAEYFEGVDC